MEYRKLFNTLESMGMTKYQLAKEVGISPSTVGNWSRGINSMTLDMAIRVRDAVFPEMSLDELFVDEE